MHLSQGDFHVMEPNQTKRSPVPTLCFWMQRFVARRVKDAPLPVNRRESAEPDVVDHKETEVPRLVSELVRNDLAFLFLLRQHLPISLESSARLRSKLSSASSAASQIRFGSVENFRSMLLHPPLGLHFSDRGCSILIFPCVTTSRMPSHFGADFF